jgi:hypothetical protein
MPFSFQFELGQSEQVRATRIIYNRRWTTRAVYVFLFALALALIVLWATDNGYDDEGLHLPLVGLCGLVGAVTAVWLSPFFAVRGIRKKNRSASGPFVYSLNETGVEAQAPGASSSVLWANVAEVYETSDFLLFYLSAAWAMVLPKRVFRDGELSAMRIALREWVGEKARLRP